LDSFTSPVPTDSDVRQAQCNDRKRKAEQKLEKRLKSAQFMVLNSTSFSQADVTEARQLIISSMHGESSDDEA